MSSTLLHVLPHSSLTTVLCYKVSTIIIPILHCYPHFTEEVTKAHKRLAQDYMQLTRGGDGIQT